MGRSIEGPKLSFRIRCLQQLLRMTACFSKYVKGGVRLFVTLRTGSTFSSYFVYNVDFARAAECANCIIWARALGHGGWVLGDLANAPTADAAPKAIVTVKREEERILDFRGSPETGLFSLNTQDTMRIRISIGGISPCILWLARLRSDGGNEIAPLVPWKKAMMDTAC